MTAAEGGSALTSAPAGGVGGVGVRGVGVGGVGGSGVAVRSRARRLRTVLGLARIEAWLLFCSLLVLAGLIAGGAVIWLLIRSFQPLWWSAAWRAGYGQAILAMAVLIAGQLAVGRVRRDAMADLYASFPATAGTRVLGHLAGLAGALPASLALVGGTVAVVQLLGPVGAPGLAPLAAGLALVIAAGAAGIAIGTRFPHPLAGVLGAIALFVPIAESNNINGPGSWLLPWHEADGLGQLPGPLAGYPPAGAHAAELAAIAVLAGLVALAVTVRGARARGLVVILAALAVAASCLAGAVQLRPLPAAELNQLATEVAAPASVQHCTTASGVRYCLYPGFGRDLPSVAAPVRGVLAHVPVRPGQLLTVRQTASPDFAETTLTHGHPRRQVSRWNTEVLRAPGTVAAPSAIYLPVGSWPAAGAHLADAHFALALATADWAVRFSPAAGSARAGADSPLAQCVPLDQAREAIAIWLAILAAHPLAGELQSPLGRNQRVAEVRNTTVLTWVSPGSLDGYLAPATAGPQTTAAGYLLASAMSSLPEAKVSRVLTGAWGRWLNWHTTDAQLAAALGIPMPHVPAVPALPPPGRTAGPALQSPLCAG
jgi:hypothetical protein